MLQTHRQWQWCHTVVNDRIILATTLTLHVDILLGWLEDIMGSVQLLILVLFDLSDVWDRDDLCCAIHLLGGQGSLQVMFLHHRVNIVHTIQTFEIFTTPSQPNMLHHTAQSNLSKFIKRF